MNRSRARRRDLSLRNPISVLVPLLRDFITGTPWFLGWSGCSLSSIMVSWACGQHGRRKILPAFQNVGRFDFFKFILFAIHLDIIYV